jgi:hypothetical protein
MSKKCDKYNYKNDKSKSDNIIYDCCKNNECNDRYDSIIHNKNPHKDVIHTKDNYKKPKNNYDEYCENGENIKNKNCDICNESKNEYDKCCENTKNENCENTKNVRNVRNDHDKCCENTKNENCENTKNVRNEINDYDKYCENGENIKNDCNKNEDKNKNNVDITKLLNGIDETFYDNVDYLQQQINMINESYNEIKNELLNNNTNTNTNVNVNYNELIDNMNEKIDNIECICVNSDSKKQVFVDTNLIHTIIIPKNIDFIYLTMVAGGGAGGIGHINNMFYYSGGGGGSGAALINKPIMVEEGDIINIKVGKGSDIRNDIKGENSYIEIINKGIITVSGGENGYPSLTKCANISGGKGGESHLCMLKGCDGKNGITSLPSFASAIGGNGGSSIFFEGGKGGGSYFDEGGCGGSIGNLIGKDGHHGSGGGGSCPKTNINMDMYVSGNGGDGIVIIEW